MNLKVVNFSVELIPKDGKTSKDESDFECGNDETISTSQSSLEARNKWTDIANAANENWGQELSSGAGSLSDWGTVNAMEDWDAPTEVNPGSDWGEQKTAVSDDSTKSENLSLATIGSEVKSGRFPKKEAASFPNKTEKPVSGQFGAIGQPVASLKESGGSEVGTIKDQDGDKDKTIAKDQLYKDVIGKNTIVDNKEELLKTAKSSGPKNMDISRTQESKATSPKLTGWSGLDGFEPLPGYDAGVNATARSVPSVIDSNTKMKTKPSEQTLVNNAKISNHVTSGKESQKDIALDKNTTGGLEAPSRSSDEWGWTTASSKKTKVKIFLINFFYFYSSKNGCQSASAFFIKKGPSL